MKASSAKTLDNLAKSAGMEEDLHNMYQMAKRQMKHMGLKWMRNHYTLGLLLAAGLHAQTSATVMPVPNIQFFDTTTTPGVVAPCVGCSLYSYAAGTTTPLATYTDYTATTTNSNPVVFNSAGYNANVGVWLGAACYKFVLQTAAAVTIWSQDHVCGLGNPTSYTASAFYASGAAGTTRLLAFETTGSLRWKLDANNTAESGGNAGSDLSLEAYSDTGTLIGTAMLVTRATAQPYFPNGISSDVVYAPNLYANGASSTVRLMGFQTSGSLRWRVDANGTPESGANAGSDFSLEAYSDAGSLLFGGPILTITRSTGAVAFNTHVGISSGGLSVTGGMTLTNSGSDTVTFGTIANIRMPGLSTTPGSKQPLCVDTGTGRLYYGSGSAC